MAFIVTDRRNDQLSDNFRNWILGSDLNHAWSAGMSHGKNASEIKVVRKDNKLMLEGITHDGLVERLMITEVGPVLCLNPVVRKKRYPLRREVHVDQELHFGEMGTSNSSERHAAYASASPMSSFSR